MAWRGEKAKKQNNKCRTDENTPTRSAPRKTGGLQVHDDSLQSWGQTLSPPKTPSKLKGHVNAISPLMEVCPNTGRSTGDAKRCRARASPIANAPLPFSASPPSALLSQRIDPDFQGRSQKVEPTHKGSPRMEAGPTKPSSPLAEASVDRCTPPAPPVQNDTETPEYP